MSDVIDTDKLALNGGIPYRTTSFPERAPFGDEEIVLVTEALQSQNLMGLTGPKSTAFEQTFAEMYGVRYAVGSTSGTAAIHTALGTIDPNPGDEIITAPLTDAGTIVPILYQNCIPVFADVDETFNMEPEDVERKITDRTAAILVVHLFGNACNMDAMAAVACRHGIPLIEDVSQAHVTRYRGRYLGTWGDIAAVSFQQSKHLTTGEGGMTFTNREEWARRMLLFRDKGWARKADYGARAYEFLGLNYRMSELQGALGLAQLKKVRAVVERRMALGQRLSEQLHDIDGLVPAMVTEGSEHSYWAYPLRITGWPLTLFTDTLAEEVPAALMPGYTGLPIYSCMDALTDRKTFGTSGHPLDGCHGGRILTYGSGLCPKVEAGLEELLVIFFHEGYCEDDIDDLAGAIRKVARLLPRK